MRYDLKRKSMTNKMVSIIIPVYNAEKTLQRCVDSVLNQTYTNLQLILINDGSHDRSLEICNSYQKQDHRVIVINKENGGASSARNEGLKNATGYFVEFVDSDDELDLDYIEKMLNYFIDNSDLDLIISSISIVGNQTRDICFDNSELLNKQDFKKFFNQPNFYGLFSSPCNKIYIRSKIKQFFPLEVHNGEDAIFNVGYFKNCNKIYLAKDLKYNYYYENEGSLTKKYSEQRFYDSLHVINEMNMFLSGYSCDCLKIANRLLLREVCSITKALAKSDSYSKKQKKNIVKSMMLHPTIQKATKSYNAFGIAEKLAFMLIKLKLSKLFLLCSRI